MIFIVDFGMGNLRSIQHKLEKAGVEAIVTSNPAEIENASKLILPGVGHFSTGMQNLRDYNLIDILNKKALEDKIPILGICLGMQLFTKSSEEGKDKGLGWIDAYTRKFSFKKTNQKIRIPHVGWNVISIKKNTNLFNNVDTSTRFYFTHSYYVDCNYQEDIASTTDYGINFVSSIEKENIFGTQFHPEKSHHNGFEIIKNFATI